jgi:hypothetical protein
MLRQKLRSALEEIGKHARAIERRAGRGWRRIMLK